MKNPTDKVLAKCVQMRADGQAWPAILKATGLSHSQAEIAVLRATLPKDAFEAFSPDACVRLRKSGVSWGEIGVRLSVPESRVRSAYKEATGKLSEGQRIGRGGRFLNADPDLYADVLQAPGTVIPREYGRTNARTAAAQQRLMALEPAELKALAADYGIASFKKGTTKATMVTAIVKSMGLNIPEKAKANA
jgi:hypothetical protein